jgi:putative peptide zinc metalloprotease protein
VRVQRQQVRDRRWYLLVDAATGRQYRLNQQAYEFVGRCDGQQSVDEIWNHLLKKERDDAPTQDEVLETLTRLDECGLVAFEEAFDAQQLVRKTKNDRQRRVQAFNPFALRISFGDPSTWLLGMDSLARIVFSRLTLWIVLALITAAIGYAMSVAQELVSQSVANMTTPRYLALAWIVFPCMKALHELGHALAVRRWGGEVRTAGFTLFLLVPSPYVDASAASAFPKRHQRLVVGSAGILAELTVAAIALAVWMNVQPGMVRDAALVTMFIGTVSTLVFNGNPLLRLDAYYVLCDALDLPNLAARSSVWWGHTASRLLGGVPGHMELSRGELKWLIAYTPLSIAYGFFVAFLVVLWAGAHSTLLAVALGLVFAFVLIVRPTTSMLRGLLSRIPYGVARWRAGAIVCCAAIVCFGFVLTVPVPFSTLVTGIALPHDGARLRAGTDGFVTGVIARDGESVREGQVVTVLEDPVLITQRDRLISRLEQLQANRFNALMSNQEEARNTDEEIARVQSELDRIDQKVAALNLRAPSTGVLVIPNQQDIAGTFVRQGAIVGYVLDHSDMRVRAVVPEYDGTLIREATRAVEVQLAETRERFRAELVRDTPAATFELPSAALGDRAGGPYPTDPSDKDGLRTRDPIILIDLTLPGHELRRIGGRAYVRFEHDPAPLAGRWYRELRQVFLQHFNPAT